jgi:hypothetical protein
MPSIFTILIVLSIAANILVIAVCTARLLLDVVRQSRPLDIALLVIYICILIALCTVSFMICAA